MASMAEGDLASLDSLSDDELTHLAGRGGHEVRTWVAAYAAAGVAGAHVNRNIFYRDIPQWNAGMGIAAAEARL
jgi:2,3-dihydroxyphenylpropionate 1,2-dioxygenase